MPIVIALLGVVCLVAILGLPRLLDRFANRVGKSPVTAISDSARSLHQSLWIADLHCDALLWDRDLLTKNKFGQVDIPRLIEGNCALQAFTIVSKIPFGLNFENNADNLDILTFLLVAQRWPRATWGSLRERALFQARKLHKLASDSGGKFTVIRSKSDFREFIVQRQTNSQITAGFLGVEGAQVLEGDLANVKVLFDAGVRMMSPSHFVDTEVGGSAHGAVKGGLTDFGRSVVQSMEQLCMILDLAHASPHTIEDALNIATKPVVVSHTGLRGTCDNLRNLSDEHATRIAEKGGVIGIAFFKKATCGHGSNAIAELARYAVNLVGVESVALGSDFDGAVRTPFDSSRLDELTQALVVAGFTDHEIEQIMGLNVRRLLLDLLPDKSA